MKCIRAIFLAILVLMSVSQTASAYEVKVQPDISISENYISNQNLYLASLRTWFNTTFDKDIVSVAYEQTIAGSIFGDVTLLGKDITLKGESYDDVRIVGDIVVISGVVNKDLVIIARKVLISSDAIINGDTLILAQTVDVQGQFLGQSQITASSIDIHGSIVGPTTLTGSKITFASGAKVISEISYFSPQRAIIEQDVELQQQLNFNQIQSLQQNDVVKRLFFAFVSFWAVIKLIATLFVIFILIHLFKVFLQRIIDMITSQKIILFVTGITSFILIPILAIILFASLILIPVSIIVGSIFIIMIILLPAVSAIITAALYQTYVKKEPRVTADFNLSALALVFLTFIDFVPYLGAIVIYLVYVLSFGAMVLYCYEHIRRKKINK